MRPWLQERTCKVMLDWPEEMACSRVKNIATVEDVSRVVRVHLRVFGDSIKETDLDKFCESFKEFLVDLLYVTPRPTKGVLAAALEDNVVAKSGEVTLFCERVMSAVQHIRYQSNRMTSGAKLTSALKELCRVLISVTSRKVAKDLVDLQSKLEQAEVTPARITPPRAKLSENRASSPKAVTFSEVRRRLKRKMSSPAAASSAAKPSQGAGDCRGSIFAAYGLAPSTEKNPGRISCSSAAPKEELVEISGSSDEEPIRVRAGGSSGSKDADTSKAARDRKLKTQFIDSAKCAVVRVYDTGEEEIASMTLGPQGFAMAQFGNEALFATEITNLALTAMTLPVKRPVMKKPAGKARASKKAEAKEESEELEEPEVEDLEEEEEEEEEQEEGDQAAEAPVEEQAVEAPAEPPVEEQAVEAPSEPAVEEQAQQDNQIFTPDQLIVGCFTDQSYIQAKLPGGKKKLVIAISKTRSASHAAIARAMLAKLKKMKSITKSQAKQMRDQMC